MVLSILALGREIASPSEITNFSGIYSHYLTRELRAMGASVRFCPARPPYDDLDLSGVDHILAFGSRHFERAPKDAVLSLSERFAGALCQFNDLPLEEETHPEPAADITFTVKGESDDKHCVIGWAADPELCLPQQPQGVLSVLIDHPDYVSGRGDLSAAVFEDARALQSLIGRGRSRRPVEINVLTSPKGQSQAIPFDQLCRRYYSRAHIFMVTHPESVGLSVIETATAGVLAVVPKGFIARELVETVRRVEYEDFVPWPDVLQKINPLLSRRKATRQTWAKVAGRVVAALQAFKR